MRLVNAFPSICGRRFSSFADRLGFHSTSDAEIYAVVSEIDVVYDLANQVMAYYDFQ